MKVGAYVGLDIILIVSVDGFEHSVSNMTLFTLRNWVIIQRVYLKWNGPQSDLGDFRQYYRGYSIYGLWLLQNLTKLS